MIRWEILFYLKKIILLPLQLQKFEHLVKAQCLAAEYVPSMYSLQVKVDNE